MPLVVLDRLSHDVIDQHKWTKELAPEGHCSRRRSDVCVCRRTNARLSHTAKVAGDACAHRDTHHLLCPADPARLRQLPEQLRVVRYHLLVQAGPVLGPFPDDPDHDVDRPALAESADLCLDLVRENEFREDVYLRPIVYCPALRVGPGMDDEHALAIYNIPMGHYHDPSRAIDVMISTWRRIDDNAIPARGKINGAYVNSSLAITEAHRAGFDDAILLNQDGHVSEGSVMNLFIVRGDTLVTPPVTANILEGITRSDVMGLALSESALRVIEREIDRTELYYSDEIFFCGTGAKILGVGSVDRRVIGEGGVGPVTQKLQKLYDAIVHGDDDRYADWLTPVYSRARLLQLE